MHALQVVDMSLATVLQRGCSPHEAVTLAERLVSGGKIDVLDIGDIASSPGLLSCAQEIACELEEVAIAARAPMHLPSVSAAWAAIRDAEHPILQIVVHLTKELQGHPQDDLQQVVLELVRVSVAAARTCCPSVAFIGEEAARCAPETLVRVVETATLAGAETVILPDSADLAQPQAYSSLFRLVRERVRGSARILWGAQTHQRFGTAAATTVAAIEAGARLITVEDEQDGSGDHPTHAEIERLLQARPELFGPLFLSL